MISLTPFSDYHATLDGIRPGISVRQTAIPGKREKEGEGGRRREKKGGEGEEEEEEEREVERGHCKGVKGIKGRTEGAGTRRCRKELRKDS